MKKILVYIISISIFIFSFVTFNYALERNINGKITNDTIKIYGDTEKDNSVVMQKQIAGRKNIFMLYGSSELGTTNIFSNPINFFPKSGDDFDVCPVGRGYTQDLQHLMKFASNPNIKNKKVALIISMQWFLSEDGISSDNFLVNFSEIQFYETMNNKNISEVTKKKICERVYELTKNNKDFKDVNIFTKLYSGNSFISKLAYGSMKPYFYSRYYMLKTSDNIKAYKSVHKNENENGANQELNSINWNDEFNKAQVEGSKYVYGNDYNIANDYFNKNYKGKLNILKDYDKDPNRIWSKCKESEDLKLLLQVCKDNEIKPLFILMPVNGKWYDYTGINKENRSKYFENLETIINSYKFDTLNLQDKEYEKYLMQDGMHLGWKGWVYVDQKIDEYYNKN